MSALQACWGHARAWLRPTPYNLVRGLLVVWAVGLVVAAAQLDAWRQELSRTLMHLNADAQFRARVQHREAVDPEWYRRKALSLLSATERLNRDTTWTLFVPGSWRPIDDLEEQVQARIAREFGEIVVETIRRELFARASKLTGVALVRGAGDLRSGSECQSPVPQLADRRLTGAAEELPEFAAVAGYVREVEQLDAALQAFLSLQHAQGQPEQLRKLVAYTLNAELPGTLAHSALLFQGGEEVSLQPALMQSRLQWATRCSLAKAMSALHGRLLNTNELFALEQAYVGQSAGLFEASARALPFDRAVERYRAVHAVLQDQHALLARGRNDWMRRQGKLQLGPAYDDVLQRIARTRLFGPEIVQQLESQSGAAFAEFRRQFEAAFGSPGEPGIVWLEQEQRFAQSPERSGLRDGLGGLLQANFVADPAPHDGKPGAKPAAGLAAAAEEARGLANARVRFLTEHLGRFPPPVQPAILRTVDARVSDLIYQKAARALKAALPADTATPLEPAVFRQQRDQVLRLQALLRESGSPGAGERLVATLDGEVLRRLAVLADDWRQQPLNDVRGTEYAWWQGEALPIAQAIGASDTAAVPAQVQKLAARLELLTQQAKTMIALGSPALQEDAAAQRWLRLQAELERYQARHADSSLLRLERYLAAVGELRRDNCADRLAAQVPRPAHDDEVAQRHVQIHNALAHRCNELRVQASVVVPAAAAAQ